MTKPVLVMLLSRHPYAEKSGRGFTLRQRIDQMRKRFDLKLIVMGAPAGDASDAELTFLPMAKPPSILFNAFRLLTLPLQTWLYYSRDAHRRVLAVVRESGAVGVYVDFLRLAPLTEGLPPDIARVIDYDDVLSVRYRRAAGRGYDIMGFLADRVGLLAPIARFFAPLILRAEAARCEAYERGMLDRADLVMLVSPSEARVLDKPRARILVAPPIVTPLADPPKPGRRLIFLGNHRYAENVSMLRAMAQALAELDRELAEDVTLDIVGDHAPELPAEINAPRMRFLGRVPDLADLAGAGIFLAPVTSGSGVKLKVLDGMALGCPVVATPKALEGLVARANRDLIIASDTKAVLKAAVALRDRETLKAMLAERARAYIERAHGRQIDEQVGDGVEAAIARARSRQETL